MRESILTIINQACGEIGLPDISSAVVTTNAQARQLLALAKREGRELRKEFPWPELTREATITTVASQASYALPVDFNYSLFDTVWNRSTIGEMTGPISPRDWQSLASGASVAVASDYWRIKGISEKKFFISPTPSATTTGQTIAFEYQSINWVRPRDWIGFTAFALNSFCFFNGNYYRATVGGTTSAAPPTHTTGSVVDGTVTWIFFNGVYESPTADTDIPLFDDDLFTLGIKWRFRHHKGLEWQSFRSDYEAVKRAVKTDSLGARTLSLDGEPDTPYYFNQIPG